MESDLFAKYEKLKNIIAGRQSAAVAFSGGVDSALLLFTAHEVLGKKIMAVTLKSDIFPERELIEARDFCLEYGIEQYECEINVMGIKGFCQNPENRCYLCKKELFGRIFSVAAEHGISSVMEGSNTDDKGDYRPGMLAVKELGVSSPLLEAGLCKADIRALSCELGLKNWEKPSFACLATRIPYGEEITEKKLLMTGKAEQYLTDMGFTQVRVRLCGSLARIEVLPQEFEMLMQDKTREQICEKLKELGFSYVTLDLKGYRTGSMNEVI